MSPQGAAAPGAAGIKQQTPLLPDTLAASPAFCLGQLSRGQIPSVGHVSARAGAAVAVSRAGPSLLFPSLAGGEQSHKNSKSPVWEARRARLVAVRIMRNIWSGRWEQLGAGCQGGRRGRCALGTGTAGMDPSLPGATGPVTAWASPFPAPCIPKMLQTGQEGRGLCCSTPAQPAANHSTDSCDECGPPLMGPCSGGWDAEVEKGFALFNYSFANKGQRTPGTNICWQCQRCQHRANPSGVG